jgi:tRNA U34 5-methylaminomethyl-2-thiouridine-forming methyltransferase MnmC
VSAEISNNSCTVQENIVPKDQGNSTEVFITPRPFRNNTVCVRGQDLLFTSLFLNPTAECARSVWTVLFLELIPVLSQLSDDMRLCQIMIHVKSVSRI